MKKLIFVIFFIFPIYLFSETLESGIHNFLNDRMFDKKCSVTTGDIIHVETGKKWQLSKKIKSEIVNQLNKKPKISVIKNLEEIKEESKDSISGVRIIEAEYIITGTYEIDEREVKISLSFSLNKDGKLLRFIQFIVLKSSVEMYLKDYSDRELNYIISRQNDEISNLLAKQKTEREKLLQLQQVKQQKNVITRLKKGEEFPFKVKDDYTYSLLMGGIISALYARSWYLTSDNLEKKNKETSASTSRYIGSIFYFGAAICFGYFGHEYFSENDYFNLKLASSNKNITLALSKRF